MQLVKRLCRQRKEKLVRLDLLREMDLRVTGKHLRQTQRMRIGPTSVLQPEVILQIRNKLGRQVTQLGSQLGRLLTDIGQVFRDLRTEGDHRLTHHHAVFRTTKTQDIDTRVNRHLTHSTLQVLAGIGQSGAVHMEIHIIRMEQVCDRPYLLNRIDRTQLRHLRDIDRLRLRMVANTKITQMRTDQLGSQLAIRCSDRHDRAAGHPGRSATLIDVDMRRLRAKNAIERTGYRLQGHRVRSRTIKQEKRLGHLTKNIFQLTGRGLGPRIVTVANRMVIICLDHRFHNPGVNAGVIVTSETSHLLLSLVFNFKLTTKVMKNPAH